MSQLSHTSEILSQQGSQPNADWVRSVVTKLGGGDGLVTGAIDILQRIGAKQQWSQLPSNSTDDPYWVACALYIAAAQQGQPVKLMALLNATGTKFHDFFTHLQLFIPEVSLSEADEKSVQLLRRRVVVITILFHRYERDFNRLFSPARGAGNAVIDDMFVLGWTLFVLAKQSLLGKGTDLLLQFHYIISVLMLLVINAPQELRSKEFDTLVGKELTNTDATLSALCTTTQTVFDEVRISWGHFLAFVQSKCDNGLLPKDSDSKTGKIPNLFADKSGASTELIPRLRAAYTEAFEEFSEVDELIFLESEDVVGRPKRNTDESVSGQPSPHAQPNGRAAAGPPTTAPASAIGLPAPPVSQMQQPLPGQPSAPVPPAPVPANTAAIPPRTPGRTTATLVPPQTPMTEAMAGLSWLKSAVKACPDGPSEELLAAFKESEPDPTEVIIDRVKKLSELIDFPGTTDDPQAQAQNTATRRSQAVKLYYRALSHMLNAERVRLQQANLGKLLSSDLFHRSLLACCMEVTLFSYQMIDAHFPYILERMKLQPFDFCKIIENFVTHERDLPPALKRHLARIEDMIAEELAWSEGSTLYPLLKARTPGAAIGVSPAPGAPAANTATGGKGVSPSLRFVSPARPQKRAHPQSAAGASASPAAPVAKSGSAHALELFLRKSLRVGIQRVSDWSTALRLPVHIKGQVIDALKSVLTENFTLMTNRHLDQQIMCCIYGVCRVNRREVTFKEIIDAYRRQRHFDVRTFKEVLIQAGEKKDIIAYYNSIFIPAMKETLKVLPSRHAPQAGGADQSPHGSPGNGRLKVSPMKTPQHIARQMAQHPHMTPTTRRMWAFGESPSRNLRQINDQINHAGSVQGRALNFDSQPPPEKKQRFMLGLLGNMDSDPNTKS